MIRIGLHRRRGLIAASIRFQCRGEYSHASLVLPSGDLIEAQYPDGVRRTHRYPMEDVDVFTVPQSPEQACAIFDFATAQIGKPYDLAMVFRFVTRAQVDRKASGRWFCSELVYAAFRKAGLPLLGRTEPWEVDPVMLGRSPLLVRSCH